MSRYKIPNKMLALWAMLVLVLMILVGMYYLPEEIMGVEIKRVDILSAVRAVDEESMPTTLDTGDSIEGRVSDDRLDTLSLSTAAADSLLQIHRQDSVYQQLKDQVSVGEDEQEEVYFEDYSSGHVGLRTFWTALKAGDAPVYVAALGDSFIEGDIFTIDVRRQLQSRYGGGGVGWMPLYSQVSGYRQGVEHYARGWKEKTILQDTKGRYLLSGRKFLADGKATVRYKLSTVPSDATVVAKLYYHAPHEISVHYTSGDSTETRTLPPTDLIGVDAFDLTAGQGTIAVERAEGATFYGVSLETDRGVILDNYSMRGNSGIPLGSLDREMSLGLESCRPYSLIILQYGLNVVSAKQSNYKNYGDTMIKSIRRLQEIYPRASIILMGVSERGTMKGGEVVTMPTVPHLIAEQRRVARETGIVFWDTTAAMQKLGGVRAWAAKGWVAKDYTHISFKGGQRLAEEMMKAFELEERYYNEIQ